MHHPEPAFGPLIAELRRERGWSQRRLAAEIGVDHATVGRWEAGRAVPSRLLRERVEGMAGVPSARGLLGDEIRDFRVRSGLTQTEFARRCGVTQPTLSRIEVGTSAPSPILRNTFRQAISLPDPPESLRDASLADCERSYESYWRTCAVFDHPDGAAWGAELTHRLLDLAPAGRAAPRLLARVYASRAYWFLARGRHHDVARMAVPAIRLGMEHGFDLTSGYALWACARSRFHKRRITDADRAVVRSIRALAHRYTDSSLPYAELVEAAHERMSRRIDDAEDRLRALSERPFRTDESGQFGGLLPEVRWATIQSYRAMFRLSAGHDRRVLDLTEAVRSDDPIVSMIFGAYEVAAKDRMGEPNPRGLSGLATRAEATGHGYALRTVLNHTRAITGTDHADSPDLVLRAGNPDQA